MNIAIWIVIALVCFVIPATALTQGGNRNPQRGQLAKHAQHVGLPLPAAMVPRVVQRIKRRQRGMGIGGATGIVVATLIFIIFFDNDDGAAPVLLIFFTAAGTALGGAWAIAAYRPGLETGRPTVARTRLVGLSDYLTKGERFGFWAVPVVLVLGAIGGIVLIQQLPEIPGINTVLIGSGIASWRSSYGASRSLRSGKCWTRRLAVPQNWNLPGMMPNVRMGCAKFPTLRSP